MFGYAKHRFKNMMLAKEPTEIPTSKNFDLFYFLQESADSANSEATVLDRKNVITILTRHQRRSKTRVQ